MFSTKVEHSVLSHSYYLSKIEASSLTYSSVFHDLKDGHHFLLVYKNQYAYKLYHLLQA